MSLILSEKNTILMLGSVHLTYEIAEYRLI